MERDQLKHQLRGLKSRMSSQKLRRLCSKKSRVARKSCYSNSRRKNGTHFKYPIFLSTTTSKPAIATLNQLMQKMHDRRNNEKETWQNEDDATVVLRNDNVKVCYKVMEFWQKLNLCSCSSLKAILEHQEGKEILVRSCSEYANITQSSVRVLRTNWNRRDNPSIFNL